jgi:hypothetical protein
MGHSSHTRLMVLTVYYHNRYDSFLLGHLFFDGRNYSCGSSIAVDCCMLLPRLGKTEKELACSIVDRAVRSKASVPRDMEKRD